MSIATAAVDADELRARAQAIQYLVTEALVELDGLPPHPQRTRLGRHLLAAHNVAKMWHKDGNMDTSKALR